MKEKLTNSEMSGFIKDLVIYNLSFCKDGEKNLEKLGLKKSDLGKCHHFIET